MVPANLDFSKLFKHNTNDLGINTGEINNSNVKVIVSINEEVTIMKLFESTSNNSKCKKLIIIIEKIHKTVKILVVLKKHQQQ